ncbi:hypothetical protein ACHAXN_004027 [Cyclotella atomus]
MKLISSLSLTFVLQANSLSSAFHVPTPTKVAVARDKSQIKHRVAPAILGTVAASLLAHPKLVNAIGVGSRVPLTAAAGVSNVAAVKAVSQTVVLLAWSLFLVVTLEWNGFEYFRHLACRIRNFGKEEEMMDVGLAKPSDWKSYTQQLLMRRKNTGVGARIGKFFRLYAHDSNDIDMANKFYQEKQYEQHHHAVHVTRSKENHPTYLESLSSKYASVDPDNTDALHEKSYLDTLSDLNVKKTSWSDYKSVIDHVKKERLDEGEGKSQQRICSKSNQSLSNHLFSALENRVSDLNDMIQMEQSMYQTSNQALKLALDASRQLHHANDERQEMALKDLEEFDKMSDEFHDTVGREMNIAAQKAAGVMEDDVKSIVYEL